MNFTLDDLKLAVGTNYDPYLARYNLYQRLGFPAQSLLLDLYGSFEDYLKSIPQTLEEHIINYNDYMDDEETLRAMGANIGIFIEVSEEFAQDIYKEKLQEVIDNLKYTGIPIGIPSLADIISYNEGKFLRFLFSYVIKEELIDKDETYYYQNRLFYYFWLINSRKIEGVTS